MSHESFKNPIAKIVRAAVAGVALMGGPKSESPSVPHDAREEQLEKDMKEAEEILGESEGIQKVFSNIGESSEKLKNETHEINIKLEEAKLRVDERLADKMLKMTEEIDATLSRGQEARNRLDEQLKGLQK